MAQQLGIVVMGIGILAGQALGADTDRAVKVSQVGYGVDERKVAQLTAPASGQVVVRRIGGGVDGVEVAKIEMSAPKHDADSGDDVITLDLSAVREPGRYVVSVVGMGGVGESEPFVVGNGLWAGPLKLAMRSFYGQRCGMAVNMGPDFPQFKYEACHLGLSTFHVSSGRTGTHECTGGWHDAGDYGRYIVNSGITTGTLLWAYELNSGSLKALNLSIPESGGKLPDFLAEVKWNLDWMLKMQDEDGGVWHKATSANFCGMVMPAKDTSPTLIIGSGAAPYKTTEATADFAAVMAIAARVYGPLDAEYAAKCLKAAESAWAWLEKTPDHSFKNNPPGIATGGYGDTNPADERLWAAAELYRTTGREVFDAYFKTHVSAFHLKGDSPQAWPNVENLALYSYALYGKGDAGVVARIKGEAVKAADEICERIEKHPYRVPLTPKQYIWGSNSVVLNYAMMLQLADRFESKPAYRAGALDCLHYVVGRNPFATSYVTAVGTKWAMHPHHRPSADDGVVEPWPGMIMGGPNSTGLRVTTRPTRPVPPMRCWVDDVNNYAVNEMAINWNAPLVFVLADVNR